jgi:hypothetical protein
LQNFPAKFHHLTDDASMAGWTKVGGATTRWATIVRISLTGVTGAAAGAFLGAGASFCALPWAATEAVQTENLNAKLS